jgi:acetate kinase
VSVLLLSAGSSSLKATLLESEDGAVIGRASADFRRAGGRRAPNCFGGEFTSAVCMTPEVRSRISVLAELAPLHKPPGLETLSAAEVELPPGPPITVFDTAFHTTLPPAAYTYPVPDAWGREWKIRRFGHGLSHAYCASPAAASCRGLESLGLALEPGR